MKIGILMIGSLYWEQGTRQSWRQSRLIGEEDFIVEAPIRYGRRSTSRGGTFTMVLSGGCPSGHARAVACRATPQSEADIIEEAEQLWTAERSEVRSNGRISANWGCVALLPNPQTELLEEMLSGWGNRVHRENQYGHVPQAPSEPELVDELGLLHIPWPTVVSDRPNSLPFDLLLATATHPTLKGNPPDYPPPDTIARAWGEDAADAISYFRNNTVSGISTFEDRLILQKLRETFPEKAEGIF